MKRDHAFPEVSNLMLSGKEIELMSNMHRGLNYSLNTAALLISRLLYKSSIRRAIQLTAQTSAFTNGNRGFYIP
jgi:hypothetical protein